MQYHCLKSIIIADCYFIIVIPNSKFHTTVIMLDVIKMIKPKQKPPPVKEEPKPEPKKFPIALPQSTKGKVLAGVVALHVVFLLYFIWFLITASITETESEVASIMRGEVEMKIDQAYTPANISTLLHFISIDPNSKHKIYNL